MAADSRRLSILTASEIDHLYGLRRFTEDDRQLYFELSSAERKSCRDELPMWPKFEESSIFTALTLEVAVAVKRRA